MIYCIPTLAHIYIQSCPLHGPDPGHPRHILNVPHAPTGMIALEVTPPIADPAAHHPHIPAIAAAAVPLEDVTKTDPRNQAAGVSDGKRSRGMTTMSAEMTDA